jgi:hypothetical protein
MFPQKRRTGPAGVTAVVAEGDEIRRPLDLEEVLVAGTDGIRCIMVIWCENGFSHQRFSHQRLWGRRGVAYVEVETTLYPPL